jgi:hypothetical protein
VFHICHADSVYASTDVASARTVDNYVVGDVQKSGAVLQYSDINFPVTDYDVGNVVQLPTVVYVSGDIPDMHEVPPT